MGNPSHDRSPKGDIMKRFAGAIALATAVIGCAWADGGPHDLSGSAVLALGAATHFCDYAYVVGARSAEAAHLTSTNPATLPDWQYAWPLRKLASHRVGSEVRCGVAGNFRFQALADGDYVVIAHVPWMRGKWETGASLIQNVSIAGAAQAVHLEGTLE